MRRDWRAMRIVAHSDAAKIFSQRSRGRARGAAGEGRARARTNERTDERIAMNVVVLNSKRRAGADQPRRLLNRHAFGSL